MIADLLLAAALTVIIAGLVEIARIWLERPGVVRGSDGVWRSARSQWRRSRR